MKERDVVLDNLKGWAILIVVLGHILGLGLVSDEVYTPMLRSGIRHLQMPLFFFLSGMAGSFQIFDKSSLGVIVLKRAKRLLLPYVSWGIISIVINRIPLISVLRYPSRILWFLWALFFISVIYYTIKSVVQDDRRVILFAIVVWGFLLVLNKMLDGMYGLKEIAYYFPYYVCGDVLMRFRPVFSGKIGWPYCVSVLGVFCALIVAISFLFKPYNVDYIFDFSYRSTAAISMQILCSLSLVILMVSFFYMLGNERCNLKAMCLLGKDTLGIYAIHFYFIYLFRHLGIGSSHFFLNLVVYLVLVTALSDVATWVIGRIKYLRFLLLGI